jgi:hypothetical protein
VAQICGKQVFGANFAANKASALAARIRPAGWWQNPEGCYKSERISAPNGANKFAVAAKR